MSKRNRENRARKQRAARKSQPQNTVPPIAAKMFEDPRARRRFAIMIPFLYYAKRNPYTPGMKLPDGSIIIGTGTNQQGYIACDDVGQLIRETQDELGVAYEEIIEVLGDSEASGLMKITESEPGALERRAEEV